MTDPELYDVLDSAISEGRIQVVTSKGIYLQELAITMISLTPSDGIVIMVRI